MFAVQVSGRESSSILVPNKDLQTHYPAKLSRENLDQTREFVETFHASLTSLSNAQLVKQAFLIAPIFFDFHKQLKMTAMAEHLFNVAARADADLFQALRSVANDDL